MKPILSIIFILLTFGLTAQELSPQLKNAITKNDVSFLKNVGKSAPLQKCYDRNGKIYDVLATCVQADATEVLKYLLEKGLDANTSCVSKTPLMYAAKYGKLEMTKILVAHGVNLKIKNNGKNALDYAIKFEQKEVEEYLNSLGVYQIKDLDGMDGPYIFGNQLYSVTPENKIVQQKISKKEPIEVLVNNKDQDRFSVQLKRSHKTGDDTYPLPQKLLAISDIEGNFNGFYSFLLNNKVIDENYNWTFGDGHLVLVGDFVDRGESVTQVLWLIYSLEEKAEKQGGKVHFILGNHEVMNINGNTNYVVEKYQAVAQKIRKELELEKSYRYLFSGKSELGRWMRSKNVIEKIGDYIFVHAGLSPEILKYDLSIKKINRITREYIDQDLTVRPGLDPTANFLFSEESPIWYRGYFGERNLYNKTTASELESVLNFYQAKKIVVGHTVVKDISTAYQGRLIRIDLSHHPLKNSGRTKGLLIENGVEYKTDDLGNRVKL